MTRASFNINITDDDIFEGPEAFNLVIISSSLPNHVILGDRNRARVTIIDDEERKEFLLYNFAMLLCITEYFFHFVQNFLLIHF